MSLNPPLVLNVLAALNCEAKGLIDHFRLKKQCDAPFALFCGEHHFGETPVSVNVAISGIGAFSMACAIGWLASSVPCKRAVWLNIGSAGHGQLSVGDGFVVSSVQDIFSTKAYFPPQVAARPVISSACMSLNAPSRDYPEEGGIDMEAAAFFDAATRFSAAECVQAFKVVSDTPDQGIEHLSAKFIQELLQPHTENVLSFCDGLLRVAKEIKFASQAIDFPEVRATHSQRNLFFSFTEKLAALLPENELAVLAQKLNEYSEIKPMLSFLQTELASVSPQLGRTSSALAPEAETEPKGDLP